MGRAARAGTPSASAALGPIGVAVHALYPTRRQLAPKVIAFVDLLAERFQLHVG